MIYDYYCTNCGNKLYGTDIVFDLAQILDLGSERFIKFSPIDLREVAERNNQPLVNGRKIRLKITLFDLLGYIGQDLDTLDQEAMQELSYDEFAAGEAMVDLLQGSSMQNDDVQMNNIKTWVDAITAKLKLQEKAGSETLDDAEWLQDTSHYDLYFWVEPVFFEGTEEIYTIKYSLEENPANLLPFSYKRKIIRGYCPKCNEPIAEGSGKYEHLLVGFLGAASAGKTSLFVSMINDVCHYSEQLGIELPEILCDGKYDKIMSAIKLNKYGWAVGKTDAQVVVEAYNATLLVKRRTGNKTILLSFVDIAGELCYDQNIQDISLDALQSFPLITSCHLYMLCTCVSQMGYGNAEENERENAAAIDNRALIQIANGIYRQRNNQDSIPPMCIVITKVDMASADANMQNRGATPFDLNNMPELSGRSFEQHGVNLKDQIIYLQNIYNATNDRDIIESLDWCKRTYDNSKTMTYMAILACSALGRPGRKFDSEKDNLERGGDNFQPIQLKEIWSWILCNLGMMPVCGNYYLPYIPSFGEGFHMEDEGNQIYPVRRVFEENEEESRTKAVYQLYLNPSQTDKELNMCHMEDPVLLDRIPLFNRIPWGYRQRKLDILRQIGQPQV